jgi:hypothetical protein
LRTAHRFAPIVDWSPEGRRALLERDRLLIRELLDLAFTEFACVEPIPWRELGFRGDDPVQEAVDWCLERFASSKPLDPSKLSVALRSYRLFTQPRWWLCQKLTTQGYHGSMTRGRRLVSLPVEEIATEEREEDDGGPRDGELAAVVAALAATLTKLHQKTCAELVAYWFDATEVLRRALGDERGQAALPDRAPKAASFHRFDAMFRFWQLHEPATIGATFARVLESAMFAPCPNEPPFRVPDGEVARKLNDGSGPREIGQARKAACAKVVAEFWRRYRSALPDSFAERVDQTFRRAFLRPTLLHALDIVGHSELPHGCMVETNDAR